MNSTRMKLMQGSTLGSMMHWLVAAPVYCRKLLISDINDLKFRQQEQKAEDSSEEREDPVILKLKLQ